MLRAWLVRWRKRKRGPARSRPDGQRPRLGLEALEGRALLSGFTPMSFRFFEGAVAPLGSPGPTGYSPAEVRHAYGFDQVMFQ